MNLVVCLNKKLSITSHDAVSAVKKTFKVRKAGHTGTLDPAATGVLLVCLNEATKITGYLSDLDKEYVVTAKLGESTDTYDSEGIVTKRAGAFHIAESELEDIIKEFTGDIEQVPPMHSAIKVAGRPLYELARKGIEIERKPRRISINSLEILRFESPFLTLRVGCSKGTYIRSLCNDIGNALGTGAYVTDLSRTKVGSFTIEGSAAPDELPYKTKALYTIDSALAHLQEIALDSDASKRAKNGNPVRLDQQTGPHDRSSPPRTSGPPAPRSPFVRLKDHGGRTFGIGKINKDFIKIERLFNI